MHAIFTLFIAVHITKKKVSANVEQLHEPYNKRPQRIRAIRSWLLLTVILAVAVIVWVTMILINSGSSLHNRARPLINYQEAVLKEAIVPLLTHELIVYEKRPTANGQELLLLPWILVFLIYLVYLSESKCMYVCAAVIVTQNVC